MTSLSSRMKFGLGSTAVAGCLAVALLAALPAVIRAVRIDPVTMLRSE